jgi:hypothetical protein
MQRISLTNEPLAQMGDTCHNNGESEISYGIYGTNGKACSSMEMLCLTQPLQSVESRIFEHPGQLEMEYEKLKEGVCIRLSEDETKYLDLRIGLVLIGKQGREMLFERTRLLRKSHSVLQISN